MKKFLSISILTILGLTVLSGCQLAKKENTPSAVTKHLVGIYCTATPLDDQEEPISCTYDQKTDTFKPDNPDISGCYLAAIKVDVSEEEGGFYYSFCSDMMAEPSINISGSDGTSTTSYESSSHTLTGQSNYIYPPDGTTEASLSLSGTLYVDPDKTDYSTDSDLYYIYLNLIYQKENGDLFITPGSPVSIMNEGESTTQTFSESYTESGIDSNATTTNTISLTVRSISDPVDSYTFYGMSDDNTILWSDTQKAATLTDEPLSLKGASYLLIKEVSTKGIVSYDVLTHTDDDAETTDPDYRNRYIATDSFYYQPSEIHIVK